MVTWSRGNVRISVCVCVFYPVRWPCYFLAMLFFFFLHFTPLMFWFCVGDG